MRFDTVFIYSCRKAHPNNSWCPLPKSSFLPYHPKMLQLLVIPQYSVLQPFLVKTHLTVPHSLLLPPSPIQIIFLWGKASCLHTFPHVLPLCPNLNCDNPIQLILFILSLFHFHSPGFLSAAPPFLRVLWVNEPQKGFV